MLRRLQPASATATIVAPRASQAYAPVSKYVVLWVAPVHAGHVQRHLAAQRAGRPSRLGRLASGSRGGSSGGGGSIGGGRLAVVCGRVFEGAGGAENEPLLGGRRQRWSQRPPHHLQATRPLHPSSSISWQAPTLADAVGQLEGLVCNGPRLVVVVGGDIDVLVTPWRRSMGSMKRCNEPTASVAGGHADPRGAGAATLWTHQARWVSWAGQAGKAAQVPKPQRLALGSLWRTCHAWHPMSALLLP